MTFPRVILLVLQKGVKSLQGRLAEFYERLEALSPGDQAFAVTPGAWTQARAKLAHTAFIALNAEAVLATFYTHPEGADAVRRWQGHRLCAIDGSFLFLPESEALGAHFGWTSHGNKHGASSVRHVMASASVYFDLLNGLGIDAQLEPFRTGERELGARHVRAMVAGDVVVTDRGYCGLEWFLRLRAAGADFVCRVPRRWQESADALFAADQENQSVDVALDCVRMQRRAGLPPGAMRVRLITVRLPSGELEVLATSLHDEARYPVAMFKEVYGLRWGVETFYGALKGHLEVERFSGESVEAVRQDFFASVFLSNVESILSAPAQAQLSAGDGRRRHPAQVNRARSFHALKCHALELFGSDLPIEEVLSKLTQLMRATPNVERRQRRVERRPPCQRRSLWHLRYKKKHTF